MGWRESVRVAWRGLSGNKLRAALTMLGIIIGVASVVALVAVGQGATRQVSSQIERLGSNLIVVTPVSSRGGRLSLEDAEELVARVPTITAAVPSVGFTATAKWQTFTHETTVEGVTGDLPAVRNYRVEGGRFLGPPDVAARRKVAVLGQKVVGELFAGTSPLGREVMVSGEPFTVVGILEAKGASMGRDQDDVIFIPVTVAQRMAGTNQVGLIYVKAAGPDEAPLAVGHLEAIFRSKFRREDAVQVTSQDQLLSTVSDTSRTFTIMLGAIAGISLLVGGVGIMNIMLVSVAERTREIGVRKALGARNRDILAQFLIEAVLLSVLGGVAGILAGMGGARFISRAGGWATEVSLPAVLVAFLFSAGVGLFFGVYPAHRAAVLDPIQALRHE